MTGLLSSTANTLVCLVIYNLLFARAIPFVGNELFIGCYARFNIRYTRLDAINVKECLTSCVERAYIFSALTSGGNSSECHCGTLKRGATTIPIRNCLRPCEKDDETCNKLKFYSVYTAVPTYLGCFRDTDNRDLANHTFKFYNIDNPVCFDFCSNFGNKYASTQGGYECFCGDEYGKYGSIPESECNQLCYGIGNQTCGGDWANSVYSTYLIPALQLHYDDVFHCEKGAHVFGLCRSRECKPGWMGRSCNLRNCAVENGQCGKNECRQLQIGNFFTTECLCAHGFGSFSIYHECEGNRT